MTITIPPAALEAGARAIDARVSEPGQCSYHDMARAAFLAMLEAWPGMSQLQENDSASIREMAALILPLTQEKPDDKA